MYPSTLIHPLLCETGLISASTFLKDYQKQYAYWLFSFSDQQLIQGILLISLRKRDGAFQQEELQKNNLIWTENTRPTLYRQWLAWQITIEYSIDPADGVEPVESMEPNRFKGKIVIQAKKNAIVEAKKY